MTSGKSPWGGAGLGVLRALLCLVCALVLWQGGGNGDFGTGSVLSFPEMSERETQCHVAGCVLRCGAGAEGAVGGPEAPAEAKWFIVEAVTQSTLDSPGTTVARSQGAAELQV